MPTNSSNRAINLAALLLALTLIAMGIAWLSALAPHTEVPDVEAPTTYERQRLETAAADCVRAEGDKNEFRCSKPTVGADHTPIGAGSSWWSRDFIVARCGVLILPQTDKFKLLCFEDLPWPGSSTFFSTYSALVDAGIVKLVGIEEDPPEVRVEFRGPVDGRVERLATDDLLPLLGWR